MLRVRENTNGKGRSTCSGVATRRCSHLTLCKHWVGSPYDLMCFWSEMRALFLLAELTCLADLRSRLWAATMVSSVGVLQQRSQTVWPMFRRRDLRRQQRLVTMDGRRRKKGHRLISRRHGAGTRTDGRRGRPATRADAGEESNERESRE